MSVLAGNDLCSWLWNRALFAYPVCRASKTRTCKSDNNQEKASSSWFVKRRPWAIVLSAIHRSLKSMELWLQLHHRESGSFYLDCGKLWNSNNMEENCLILGFVKIPDWDQVHWQVLNCCCFLRTLERFGWAAEISQAKISVFSWIFLNIPFFIRAAGRRSLSFLRSFGEWNKHLWVHRDFAHGGARTKVPNLEWHPCADQSCSWTTECLKEIPYLSFNFWNVEERLSCKKFEI